MKGRTAGAVLAVILMLTPLVLGTPATGYDGTSTPSSTSGCAGLDSVYTPVQQEDTALGSWDDCSDGSRVRFVGREDDLQMDLDPSRRQIELGYRQGDIVWHGRQYGSGHYQGEFKVADTFGTMRWSPCDVEVRGGVLTLCQRITCRRTSTYR